MVDDVNANIRIDLDTSDAIASLRTLQAQISAFNQSVIKSNATAVAAQKGMLSTLTAQIGATQQFTTSMVNVESSVSRLGRSIDKNKLSLGEYFRYGVASSKNFGRVFGREHTAVMELATDRVKRLQTQYIALGEAQNGMTRAMAVRPMNLFNADAAIAVQRQQIFNKLLHDGSTSLINFGKNTQWAGRQLMVGFTVPLTIFGGMAGKVFMDLEKQVVKFRRVYGDATTPLEETNGMILQVQELAKEFTKYGIAVSDTIGLAGDAAAAGAQGEDLLAATAQSTRLSTLGMIDQQQALTATIALQSAFRMNTEELANSVNFLNAVENQTVVSLADITEAIPKVAPVIQGLGGDVQDLAVFMAAMREGGVNAAEGANALKSGLASLINPTKGAREQLEKVGINIDAILSANKGDIQGTVRAFGEALMSLDKFERQQTLAKVFGKYQFARLGALFENISRDGSQAQRVVDLTTMSIEELGALAEKELGAIEESVGVKFTAAVEKLKLAIAPIGEVFLKVATPIIDFATKLLDKFNELSPGVKNFIAILVGGLGVVVPTVIMLIGLFANFAGNAVKGLSLINNLFNRVRGGAGTFEYLSNEQLDATAAAASLEGQTNSLTGALNIQRTAVGQLARAYGTYTAAAQASAANLPQGFRGPLRGMATGGLVGGTGNKDSEPTLLTPGEFVINAEASKKFAPVLNAINSGKIGMYNNGKTERSPSIFGGQEVVLAPHTMLAPGNVPGGFGMAREFFTQGGGFEQSLRATAVAVAGIEGNIRLTDRAVAEMSQQLLPYTQQITDDLRITAQEMQQSGQSAKHISEIFEKAQPRLQKTFAQMQRAGGTIAAAGVGLRKFAFPTESEMMAEGERRVPGGTIAQSGAIRRTEYRSRRSASLSRIRSVYEKMFGSVPRGFTSAHVTPESMKLLGGTIPLGGSGMASETEQTAKLKAYIEKKSKENAQTYSKTFSKTLETGLVKEMADASVRAGQSVQTGVLKGANAASPPPWSIQLGSWIGEGIESGMTGSLADINAKLRTRMMTPGGGFMLPPGETSPLPSGNIENLANQVNQTTGAMSKVKGAANKFGSTLMRGSMKMQGAFFALDGLVFAASMMDNSMGEFAQKILPAVFAFQGITMVLPLLKGVLLALISPLGLIVAAIGGLAAAFIITKNRLNEMFDKVLKSGIDAAGSMEKVAEGGAIFNKKIREIAKRNFGLQTPQRTAAQEFFAGEEGQSQISELRQQRQQMSREQFGREIGLQTALTAATQGWTAKQIDAYISELSNQLGDEKIYVALRATLAELIDPENKEDILKNGLAIKVRGELGAQFLTGQATFTEELQKDLMQGISAIPMMIKPEEISKRVAEGLETLPNEIEKLNEERKKLAQEIPILLSVDEEEYNKAKQRLIDIDARLKEITPGFPTETNINIGAGLQGVQAPENMPEVWDKAGKAAAQYGKSVFITRQAIALYKEALDAGRITQDEFNTGMKTLVINMNNVKKFGHEAIEAMRGIEDLDPRAMRAFRTNFIDQAFAGLDEEVKNNLISALDGVSDEALVTLGVQYGRGSINIQEIIDLSKYIDQIPEQHQTRIMFEYGRGSLTGEGLQFLAANMESISKFNDQTVEFMIDISVLGQEAMTQALAMMTTLQSVSAGPAEKAGAQMFINDLKKKAKEARDLMNKILGTGTETEATTEDTITEGDGDKTKSWLEGLMAETSANLALFPGMIEKIRQKYPNIPLQIIEAIGAGEEGQKRAQEILSASPKKFREFLQKYQKNMIRESLGALSNKVQQKQEKDIARARLQTMTVDGRKVEKDIIEDILQDEGAITAILSGKIKKVREYVEKYRQLKEEQDPVEQLISQIEKTQKEIVKDLDKEIDKQQEIVNEIQDQIDVLEEKNAADQWAIRNKEREKELIDRQIESLERANEMDERRIESLQRQDELRNREADALNHELEQLSLAEEKIRDSYQQRIDALDKVAEINSFIVNQQKQQLNLSQAISEGDIYAATAAAQEMRASQADFAQKQARVGLEQGMENAVAGLVTSSGLTRDQAEERIRQIKEQSYQTSLQIRDIEDQIYARNQEMIPLKDQQYKIDKDIRDIADRIFDRETEINNIRIKQLEPAQKVLDNLNEQKIKAQETLDEMIEQAKIGAELADVTNDATGQADSLALAWHEVAKQIDAANKLAKQQQSDLGSPPTRRAKETDVSYADRMERYTNELRGIQERRQKSVDEALERGKKAMGLFGGGKIKKYGMGKMVKGYAAGNVVGVGNRDSVPAMLTPGEFVIRKTMVDKYGTPMLNAINQGAFNIPRFNLQRSTAGNITIRSQNTSNVMAPMYNNYSVNVSVSGTNASADEIANRTIMKLKQMQNMQIRSNGRGY